MKICGVGLGEDEYPRAKKQLIQKIDKSAQIVIGIFVVHYALLKKANIISFHFKRISVLVDKYMRAIFSQFFPRKFQMMLGLPRAFQWEKINIK